tara:strand:+ start:100 stop:417 length:318 start_codon:yes stop_codon:yes gene_type:complete
MGWVTVPLDTLILPHYLLQSQKFLPCLFTLDILMWMCSSFALKNLTELRTQCWGDIDFLCHQKIFGIIFKKSHPVCATVTKNLIKIIGSKHKKIISPPEESLPKK